jgi:uncharacterized protein (DUF1778 family)
MKYGKILSSTNLADRERFTMAATAKLPLRIDPKDKEVLSKAAAIAEVPVSTYVLRPAIERARKDLETNRSTFLSEAAFDKLLDALENPPEPTVYFDEALELYKKSGIKWR